MEHKLIQVTNSHELDQLINKPKRITERSSTLIDLLFSNTKHQLHHDWSFNNKWSIQDILCR